MVNPHIPFQLSTKRGPLPPPNGKPLIVQLVVAVEIVRFNQQIPRKSFHNPFGMNPVPDIHNYCWWEYGMRCGMPRLARTLEERGVRAVACINSDVIDAYPDVAQLILDAGWEFQGHGKYQRSLTEEDEEIVIPAALERLKAFTGKPVRGWIGPSLRETAHTADLLKAAGIDYISDWGVIDDLPVWMQTGLGPVVVVPYTAELNDVFVDHEGRHPPDEHFNRMKAMVAGLERELGEGLPRVLTMSFHHYLKGQPHRCYYVGQMLDYLLERSDTIFMTGEEICDWFVGTETAQKEKAALP